MLIQAAQVSAIVNGTTTRSTVKLKRTFTCADIIINVTGAGAATGTLQLFLQDSLDGGTTWNDLVASKTFTFGATVASQTYSLYGGSTEGPGLIRSITGATPAAGAEISETVPAGARWELLAFHTSFVTSAGVANRNPRLIIDDGTNIYARSATATTIAASLSPTLSFAQGYGAPTSTASGEFQLSLPIGLRLTAGHRLRTATISLQAADQYSAIQYLVREWRGLDGAANQTETFPAGLARSGPFGTLLRVREVVSAVGGSPTGPTYSVYGVFKQ
jgi:hypothetical protein